MRVFDVPETIQYSITPSDKGVLLSLWEIARGSKTREPSFLFKINQRVPSLEDAHYLLRSYVESLKQVELG